MTDEPKPAAPMLARFYLASGNVLEVRLADLSIRDYGWHWETDPAARVQLASVEPSLVEAVTLEPIAPPLVLEPVNTRAFDVLDAIAAERHAQQLKGYDADHDDEHTSGELADAAAFLARVGVPEFAAPWDELQAIRARKDRRRQLVVAAALIVAEIDRLDRAAQNQPEGGQ